MLSIVFASVYKCILKCGCWKYVGFEIYLVDLSGAKFKLGAFLELDLNEFWNNTSVYFL